MGTVEKDVGIPNEVVTEVESGKFAEILENLGDVLDLVAVKLHMIQVAFLGLAKSAHLEMRVVHLTLGVNWQIVKVVAELLHVITSNVELVQSPKLDQVLELDFWNQVFIQL